MGLDSGLIDELLKGRSTVEDIAGENGLLPKAKNVQLNYRGQTPAVNDRIVEKPMRS